MDPRAEAVLDHPPPPPRTNQTSLVPPLVLSGHARRAEGRARAWGAEGDGEEPRVEVRRAVGHLNSPKGSKGSEFKGLKGLRVGHLTSPKGSEERARGPAPGRR